MRDTKPLKDEFMAAADRHCPEFAQHQKGGSYPVEVAAEFIAEAVHRHASQYGRTHGEDPSVTIASANHGLDLIIKYMRAHMHAEFRKGRH